MKIAHTVEISPHAEGMYETTREIVAAEIAIGCDSAMVSPQNDVEGEDRGTPYRLRQWARDADVIVNHGGVGKEISSMKIPMVGMLHGTPKYTFLMEHACKVPFWSAMAGLIARPDIVKAFVTMWDEPVKYWSMLTDRLHQIPPPVDLSFWKPVDESYTYESDVINVVIADQWRAPASIPLDIIAGFATFAEKHPSARLSMYAAPRYAGAVKVLTDALEERQVLGEIKGRVSAETLRSIYNAADIVLTDSPTARTVREATACGCQVVGVGRHAADSLDPPAFAREMGLALRELRENPKRVRAGNRAEAEIAYNPKETARQLLRVIDSIL